MNYNTLFQQRITDSLSIGIAAALLVLSSFGCRPEESEIQSGAQKSNELSKESFSVFVSSENGDPIQYNRANSQKLCQIDKKSSKTDLYCMVEIQELDLYVNKLSIDVNVPPNMCEYVLEKPYYYYMHEVAYGETGGGTPSASPPGSIWVHNTPSGVIYSADKTINPNITFTWRNGSPVCDYDHTDEAGPNCCLGEYDMTILTTTINSMGAPTTKITVNEDISWGGELADCLHGPAIDTQELSQEGLPRPTIYYAENGLNTTYEIDKSIDKGLSNIYASNYFDTLDWQTNAGLTAPPALLTSNSGQLPSNNAQTHTPSAYYEYQCLDASREVDHRIRIIVREWNTQNEFYSLTNDDLDGGEPGWLLDPWAYYVLNDHTDLDDLLKPNFNGYYYPGTPQL